MPLRSICRETGTWNLLFVELKSDFFFKKQASFSTESFFVSVLLFRTRSSILKAIFFYDGIMDSNQICLPFKIQRACKFLV
jgi:hypothetical protein